jgi:hypothetical protein
MHKTQKFLIVQAIIPIHGLSTFLVNLSRGTGDLFTKNSHNSQPVARKNHVLADDISDTVSAIQVLIPLFFSLC